MKPPTIPTTLHLDSEEIPWVTFSGDLKTRMLHARPEEGFVVTQINVSPGAISELHRHTGPVFGWTNSGKWGHDRQYLYRPGTYIFETPGVLHRFFAGDEHVDAVYISYGNLERVDPETKEVTEVLTPDVIINGYFAACEAMGVPRPNVLD